MGETEDKKDRKFHKYRKQSENRGVSPEQKKSMVGMICGRKHGPTLQYKSVLHYSVHLRKQTYSLTEPVPLNCGKLAAKYPRIYGYYVYTALHGELK